MIGQVLYLEAEAQGVRGTEEARRAGLEGKWRPSYVQVLLTVGGVLVLVMLGAVVAAARRGT